MRAAFAYRSGSADTASKSGILTTVRARSPRGRRLARGTNAGGAPGEAGAQAASDAVPSPAAYGSTGAAGGPGVSIVVESTSVQPSRTPVARAHDGPPRARVLVAASL